MFQEDIEIDLIQVTAFGVVCVRECTRVKRDGVEIAKTYKRWCLNPGDSLTAQAAQVRAVCEAVWTSDVVQAWQERLAAEEGQ